MSVRRPKRPPQVSTISRHGGATGDTFADDDDDDYIASDESPAATSTATQVVGRTTADLLYESGIKTALGKVLQEIDPLEVFFITAYVILTGWSNAPHPVWPFSYFALSLLGYHLAIRPAATALMRWARGGNRPPTPPQSPAQNA